MNNDRKLLELAAKAAGVTHPEQYWIFPSFGNPLTDDGDALRLAINLELSIDIRKGSTAAISNDNKVCIIDKSTRRAITRAAAEIGKSMP